METTSLEPFLAEHPFFRGLEPDYVKLLTGCASNVRFDAGQFIFKMGQPANHFHVIRSGKVAVEIPKPQGGAITIATLGDGEVIGWSWLFPPYEWNYDIRALELTRALALDAKCLRGKCDADPKLGYELMKRFSEIMIDRMNATRMQLLDLYGKP
jgi:CRP/FNR family transcriptional regulator, cyclic AMP receptor protein